MRRDTIVGLGFLAIAGFFLFFASRLSIGTAARMGPGYVPVLCAIMLAMFGAVILAQDIAERRQMSLPRIHWRAFLCVTLAIVVFALTVRPLGLVVASILLVLIGCLADRPFRPMQAAALAVCLALAGSLIFVTGIGMQLPIWPAI